jgi:hypothetical protein
VNGSVCRPDFTFERLSVTTSVSRVHALCLRSAWVGFTHDEVDFAVLRRPLETLSISIFRFAVSDSVYLNVVPVFVLVLCLVFAAVARALALVVLAESLNVVLVMLTALRTGATSTVTSAIAGVASVLPAASVAATANRCGPSASRFALNDAGHAANAPPSSWQANATGRRRRSPPKPSGQSAIAATGTRDGPS